MGRRITLFATVALALLVIARCHDDNTVTNPAPIPQATATPVPGVPTATPRPGAPTENSSAAPTPTPAPSGMRIVDVGAGGGTAFTDEVSGGSTTTIPAGTTVRWMWISGTHSTTGGTCTAGCTPDGQWDSGVGAGMTFDHVFPSAGTFPYFCEVHGAMMQGTVVVQ